MSYSWWQNFNYKINYSRTVVSLHADLNNIVEPKEINPFYVREIRMDDEQDLLYWAEIVTDAYQDQVYDVAAAKNNFYNHLFLNITNVYFVMDGDYPIATVSIGTFKANEQYGGDARIAVRQKYQGLGLGKFLISYAYTQLKSKGINFGESIISIPRSQSIDLHFRCGFYPQINKNKRIFNKQRRYKIVEYMVNARLMWLYTKFKRKRSVGQTKK